MKKKTKPGAIQQLLSYAGNNKKQLYLSTFLATLGELFGMAPFITVSLLVAELFNKTARAHSSSPFKSAFWSSPGFPRPFR